MERLNDGRVEEDSVRRRLGIRGDGEGNVAYLPRRRKEKRVDCNGGEKSGGKLLPSRRFRLAPSRRAAKSNNVFSL